MISITMENVFHILLFSVLVATAASTSKNVEINARDGKFLMASIGDSWAAGAADTGM